MEFCGQWQRDMGRMVMGARLMVMMRDDLDIVEQDELAMRHAVDDTPGQRATLPSANTAA